MLELSDRSQYLEGHSADGGGGVDALVEHHQVDLAGLQQVGQLDHGQLHNGPAKIHIFKVPCQT